MLPFLNKAKFQTGVAVKVRQPDESSEPKEEAKDLESIIQKGIDAYKANDMKRLAQAVKEAHDCLHEYMDSNEDKEEKPSPHSFEAQNQKAAKENE